MINHNSISSALLIYVKNCILQNKYTCLPSSECISHLFDIGLHIPATATKVIVLQSDQKRLALKKYLKTFNDYYSSTVDKYVKSEYFHKSMKNSMGIMYRFKTTNQDTED